MEVPYLLTPAPWISIIYTYGSRFCLLKLTFPRWSKTKLKREEESTQRKYFDFNSELLETNMSEEAKHQGIFEILQF